jgi:predicted 3-demethylubiquinone-9 3-methyltransferase (glyoxalase superfamily)
MSKIAPCLWFANEAEEAANFYVSLLPDSRIDVVHRNVLETPSGPVGSVLFIEFTLAGQRFQALNGGERIPFNHGVSFSIDCADQAEVDRLWDRLAEEGTPKQCGWIHDKYGLAWQIVPRALLQILARPDKAAAARMTQAMFGMVKLDVAGLEAAARGEAPA